MATSNRPEPNDADPAARGAAERLRRAGLRPTRQRLVLCDLLFAKGDRHVTAEQLHEEAVAAGSALSLATVYNTLHQLRGAGLIRQIAVDGGRGFFDTNTHDHAHYYDERTGALGDMPIAQTDLKALVVPPSGMEVDRIDVIVRLRPAGGPARE